MEAVLAWNLATNMVAALIQVVEAAQDMAISKITQYTMLLSISGPIKTTSSLNTAVTLISPIELFTALGDINLCILRLPELMVTGQNSFMTLARMFTEAGFNAKINIIIRNTKTKINATNSISGNIMSRSMKLALMAGYTLITTLGRSFSTTAPTHITVGRCPTAISRLDMDITLAPKIVLTEILSVKEKEIHQLV